MDTQKKGTEWVAKPTAYINDNPAGGLTTTTNDLAHFMLAHLNTEQSGSNVLFNDPQTLETMHQTLYTPHPNMAGNAHGFWERQAGDHRVLEHGAIQMRLAHFFPSYLMNSLVLPL